VPTNFFERVIPMLQYGGTTDEQIETMLRENPQRFFSGEKPCPVV
jgi:predicted metal-dependent phosphotriesterase family hydrolase